MAENTICPHCGCRNTKPHAPTKPYCGTLCRKMAKRGDTPIAPGDNSVPQWLTSLFTIPGPRR